jgi:hypothetical protein
MMKDKKDDPEKKIPPKFGQFVKSSEFKDFLEAMLDYCRVSIIFHPSGTVQTRK